jgi:fermentation-respiration switch protein FrsA (DUF1100 family)
MGAVKEQSANLYATKLAEKGFVTLAIDLSFWGESAGTPRNAVSPDLYAEAFSAAVDYLGTQSFVSRDRIGVIGICGSGGFAISAAKIDSRIKALATVSMYDMGGATRNALHHSLTLEQRKAMVADASNQRFVEFAGGETRYTGGTVDKAEDAVHPIQREFYDFYRTPRGEYTPANLARNLTTHPTLTSNVKFLNFYPFADIHTISPRPLLVHHGRDGPFTRVQRGGIPVGGRAEGAGRGAGRRARGSLRPSELDPVRETGRILQGALGIVPHCRRNPWPVAAAVWRVELRRCTARHRPQHSIDADP